jgi:hypothetical protein
MSALETLFGEVGETARNAQDRIADVFLGGQATVTELGSQPARVVEASSADASAAVQRPFVTVERVALGAGALLLLDQVLYGGAVRRGVLG